MNIPAKILDKVGLKLHNQKNHPLEIIKTYIYEYFGEDYLKFDELSEVVTTRDNFDDLLIKEDHPCRSKSDTYYFSDNVLLRTQTSAHQNQLLRKGCTKFLVSGDVYRKDEIDRAHYPIFHQMEGLCLVEEDVEENLKEILIGLINHLFPGCEYRINDDYFPFTHPSFEIEIKYNDKWLEILGCGIIQPKILENCGLKNRKGWAFGLGLERLAMILFNIPDIRYFWSNDAKFLDQFKTGEIVKFKEYSVLDVLIKDISFYIVKDISIDNENNRKWLRQNDFYEIYREYGEDLIENIELFDIFFNNKLDKLSHCYHVRYFPVDTQIKDPSEFNKIVNRIHTNISQKIGIELGVELR